MLRSLTIALVAGSLLLGGTAFADHGAGKRAASGKAGERHAKRMAKFDANHDGKLDAAERAAMQKQRFAKLDKNHDGVLSFEEAQHLLARGKHKRGSRGAPGSNHRPDRDE